MNKKLIAILKSKCKDFGLNGKALEELASIVSERITDESSDEDIEKIADELVPFAKAMQAEVTRKLQGTKPRSTKPTDASDDESGDGGKQGNDGEKTDEQIPAYFQKFMQEMREQNNQLSQKLNEYEQKDKAAKRKADISAKAKELGLSEHLIKRISIGDDEDITEALTEYKQSLVDYGLPPKEDHSIISSGEEEVKEDAKSWAEKLPDK